MFYLLKGFIQSKKMIIIKIFIEKVCFFNYDK